MTPQDAYGSNEDVCDNGSDYIIDRKCLSFFINPYKWGFWDGKQTGLNNHYSRDDDCDSPGNHTMPANEVYCSANQCTALHRTPQAIIIKSACRESS